MEDPIIGGYTPDKVALRRAISLGIDVERSIRLLRGGYAAVAHSPISAHLRGFDPAFHSEGGKYDPRRANALLDLYGYVDHDGDGWRDLPDGKRLVLRMATDPSARARQQDELFQRDMTALGLRVEFVPALWQENSKNARAGKLMMWQLSYGAFVPDGLDSLMRLYGPASGGFNLSRFNLPEFNAIYENLLVLPDGAERDALFDKAKRLAVSYAPEKTLQHRVQVFLTQPWLIGYRENAFGPGWYQMVDIDLTIAPPRRN
jgi:ABC-type transport system substrate-binding protein